MEKEKVEQGKTTSEVDLLLGEIADAQCRMSKSEARALKAESLYRGDGDTVNDDSDCFKILWTITEMQRPLIYSQEPDPVARRRFLEGDDDEAARLTSQLLERAISYYQECDGHEFDRAMLRVRDDFAVMGRGTARVVYEAGFTDEMDKKYLSEEEVAALSDTEAEKLEADENGPYLMEKVGDEMEYEEVYAEHVYWRDFFHSDGLKWEDVWWVAFGSWLTREELIEEFGEEVGMEVPVMKESFDDDTYMKRYSSRDRESYEDCARVWEFWSKRTGTVYKLADNYHEFLEDPIEDPYQLEGFFPCPRPVYMIEETSCLDYTPEYKMYEDQALELNKLTARIDRLTDTLSVRGVYDSDLKDAMQELFGSHETQLIPSANFAQVVQRTGGNLDRAVLWAPTTQTSDVLAKLLVQRDKNLQLIYEIVGLSDILRGSTQPREAGKTQQMKMMATTGKRSRIGVKQGKMQRFARDLIRLMGEVVAELFSPETLITVSGLRHDKDVQAGAEEIMRLLRDGELRQFRIDIETDSTVAPDEIREQDELFTFLSSMSTLIASVQGAVAGGAMSPEASQQLILYAARRFPAGRDLEPLLEEAAKTPPKKEENPEQQAKMLEAQIKMAKLKLEEKELQADLMIRAQELQLKAAELQQKGQIEQSKLMQKHAEAMINQRTALINASGGNIKQ